MMHNYILYSILYTMAPKISADYEQAFNTIYGGKSTRTARTIWQECMKYVRWFMPEPLIDEFMRVHTMADSDKQVYKTIIT